MTRPGDHAEVPGTRETPMMFGALLAVFMGSWAGFTWSVSLRPTYAEELARVPVSEQSAEDTRLQPERAASSPTRPPAWKRFHENKCF